MNSKWMLAVVLCGWMVMASGCGGVPGQAFGVTVGPSFIATPAPTILPVSASETPMVCSANPEGLSLLVTLGEKSAGFQHFMLDGKGFVGGEKVLIKITGQGETHSSTLTMNDNQIGADGSFHSADAVQLDEPKMSWQIFVVHSRGTACVNFAVQ